MSEPSVPTRAASATAITERLERTRHYLALRAMLPAIVAIATGLMGCEPPAEASDFAAPGVWLRDDSRPDDLTGESSTTFEYVVDGSNDVWSQEWNAHREAPPEGFELRDRLTNDERELLDRSLAELLDGTSVACPDESPSNGWRFSEMTSAPRETWRVIRICDPNEVPAARTIVELVIDD